MLSAVGVRAGGASSRQAGGWRVIRRVGGGWAFGGWAHCAVNSKCRRGLSLAGGPAVEYSSMTAPASETFPSHKRPTNMQCMGRVCY